MSQAKKGDPSKLVPVRIRTGAPMSARLSAALRFVGRGDH